MGKVSPQYKPRWNSNPGQVGNQPAEVKIFRDYFRDIIVDEQTKEELKNSLYELEILVEGRTHQYVKTIELLRQENIHRQRAEELLKRRDAILKAVGFAAEQLMLKDDWRLVVNDVLQQIGEAARASRVYVFQNHTDPRGKSLPRKLFEWIASEFVTRTDLPETQNFYEQKEFCQWREMLEHGETVSGLAKDFPSAVQEALIENSIQSIVVVPIMIQEKAWGFIGFDHCILERQWSELEVDALKTSANIFGAAIQRYQLERVLRESRAHYRAVVDSQIEMICRFQTDGVLTFVNDAYCRYFGKERQKLIGSNFFPFNSKKERNKTVQMISSLDSDSKAGTLEHRLIMPDNKIHWHKWTYRKINSGKQQVSEYQAVGWNITDQKRAEQQLQKVLDEQEELIAKKAADLRSAYKSMVQREKLTALGILTSGIAHEINNPNNFITFNIPILEDYLEKLIFNLEQHSPTDQEVEFFGMTYPEFKTDLYKLLQNISHGSARITNTISRLRDFARPHDMNEMQLVDLESVLKLSIDLCNSEIRKTIKSVELDIPKDIPKVFTNRYSLEQVIVNLLINAAHAADKEESWIKIKVRQEKTLKDNISIRVSDNGHGLDEKTQRMLFTPFFTTKANGTGSGLGLYVSKCLLKGLGGNIEVESDLENGTCFHVILPEKAKVMALEKYEQSSGTASDPLKIFEWEN